MSVQGKMTISVKKIKMALPCIILVVSIEIVKFSMETVGHIYKYQFLRIAEDRNSMSKCKPVILAHWFGSFLLV